MGQLSYATDYFMGTIYRTCVVADSSRGSTETCVRQRDVRGIKSGGNCEKKDQGRYASSV